MSTRTKRIIGVIIAVIILLLLLLLLWLLSQRPDTAPINVGNQPTNTNQPLGSLNASGGGFVPSGGDAEPDEPEPEPEPADQRASLRSLAAAFAERYGSYSNQGDFENLEELQALMTDALAAQTDSFITGARADESGTAEYVGVTTRAINTAVSGYSEGRGIGTVTVKTQREEITSQGSRIYYQDLILDFVREGEIWKINVAQWVAGDG